MKQWKKLLLSRGLGLFITISMVLSVAAVSSGTNSAGQENAVVAVAAASIVRSIDQDELEIGRDIRDTDTVTVTVPSMDKDNESETD